jgi:dihydroceramide fatty acyl 2-hydroxylase
MPATRRAAAAAAAAAAAGAPERQQETPLKQQQQEEAPPPPPPQQQQQQQKAPAIDEAAPLVFAVGRMGPAYWDWVHRPVAGAPRFFGPAALEACSKTPWWVVPLIWLPVAAAAAAASLRGLAAEAAAAPGAGAAVPPSPAAAAVARALAAALGGRAPPPPAAAARLGGLLAGGVLLWQLLEYSIHRFAFHARGDSYWAITIHFLFHGCHHKYPLDGLRLVFPPVPAAAIASLIFGALRLALPRPAALGLMAGVLLGYVAYDVTHYALHHGGKLPGSYLRSLRLRHHHHHYQDGTRGFQISSPLFDVLLGTRAALGGSRGGGGGGAAGRGKAR